MKKIRYQIFTTLVLMLFTTLSRAENSFLVDSVSCSGASTQSFLDVLSFTCAGDLSMDGGSISANSSILLSAEGALSLNNLTLTSQDISLIAGTAVSIGQGAYINVANVGEGSLNQPLSIQPIGGTVLIPSANDALKYPIRDVEGVSGITDVQVFSGANIILDSSVTEPDSYALLLLGVSLVILASRAKAASPQRMIF